MMREIKFEGRKIIFDERDEADRSIAAEIFKFREYRIAENVIRQAKIIIDVGAHIGLFSLYCHAINPLAKIFALEPEPNNIKRLTKTLALNTVLSAKILPVALAGKTGKGRLILTPDSHNHYLGTADALEEGIIVKTLTLSALKKQEKLKQIDLLKMDIEGGEYDIFENLSATDYLGIKYIILEYHEDKERRRKDLEKILRENGFGVQVFPSQFDKTMGFVFANNKR